MILAIIRVQALRVIVCLCAAMCTVAANERTNEQQRAAIAEDLDATSLDVGHVMERGYIDVDIAENDVSVLLQLLANDPDTYIMVKAVKAPDGSLIYLHAADADDDEDHELWGTVLSDMSDSVYGQYGDLAFYLPLTPEFDLTVGTYRVYVDTEDDAPLSRATVLRKHTKGDIDRLPQVLDLNVWLVHTDTSLTKDAFTDKVDGRYRQVLNAMLRPHRLSIGDVRVYVADDRERGAYALIDEDDTEQIRDACWAMMSNVDNQRALNVVFVETLTSLEGGSAGFAPVPGSILDEQAANACVFIGDTAYTVSIDDGLDQRAVDELHAATLMHEGGHFLSLEHPTESTGDDFDQLRDTAECDVDVYDGKDVAVIGEYGVRDGEISDYECGLAGGANNVMFYSGVIDFAPFRLTRDQAWVLRRHPLFQPETRETRP